MRYHNIDLTDMTCNELFDTKRELLNQIDEVNRQIEQRHENIATERTRDLAEMIFQVMQHDGLELWIQPWGIQLEAGSVEDIMQHIQFSTNYDEMYELRHEMDKFLSST